VLCTLNLEMTNEG